MLTHAPPAAVLGAALKGADPFATATALLLGGAGIAGKLGYFAIAAPNAFWLLTTAFVLLLLSTVFKSL